MRRARPGLKATGVAAYTARLEAHGAPVARDDGLPGRRRFFSGDPVGSRLEFLEPSRENPGEAGRGPGR